MASLLGISLEDSIFIITQHCGVTHALCVQLMLNMKVVEFLPDSQMLHGPGGMLGNLQQAHNRSQQLPGSTTQVIIISDLFHTSFFIHTV